MTFEQAAKEWRKAYKAGDQSGMAHWRAQIRKFLSHGDTKEFLGEEA